jgi:acyl-CoA thioesterase-1
MCIRSNLVGAALLFSLGLIGCEPASDPGSPSGSPRPQSGFGQRFGTDVTSEPGRARTGEPAGPQPKLELGRNSIVAFGDSLTAGLGVPPDESYPAQLQRRLDAAGYRYRVINAGVSGETTAGGVRRVDWVLRSRPAVVILELGANDGLRGLDLSQTRANLEEIIRRLQAAGVTVVLAGMKLPPNYGEEYASRFAAMYSDLARQYRLPFMPFFLEGVATQPGLNQGDGIHPTGAGYRIIVDRLVPVLEPYLKS